MADQLNVLAMVLGAFALYYLFKRYGSELNIKNEGLLSLAPEEQHDTYNAEESVTPQKAKHVQHSQIDNIKADEEYMTNVHNDELHKNNTNVLPNPQISNNYSPQGNFQPAQQHNFSQLDCFPQDQLVAKDLLPREDSYNIWNKSNPPAQGALSNKNFIETGHHYGLNTQSSTLKIANLQLRSDPHIPMKSVGPWNQSTYEADTNRRPLEIGGY